MVPEITPQSTPVKSLAPTPTPISATIKHELMFNGTEGNKAVQNYLPLSNGIYTMQRNGDDVVLRKGKLEEKGYSSFVKQTDMIGFAHGDTFEQFFVKGQEYYLLSGNVREGKGLGRDLIIIYYEKKHIHIFMFVVWGLPYTNHKTNRRCKRLYPI